MRKFTADWVYPVSSPPVKEGVVITDDHGRILDLGSRSSFDAHELEAYPGTIVPGFINTHCHLELSHMKGKVDTGTGLIPFITSVVQQRGESEAVIREAIRQADEEMYNNGIVAVGDISNTADTFAQKRRSPLRYYTFVEMFDFLQDRNAQSCFEQYHSVYAQLELPEGHRKTCVPHAPYTVSESLFGLIRSFNAGSDVTVSMHNQEMQPENDLFRNKTGKLIDFYASFDIPLASFKPIAAGSIMYAIRHLDPGQRTLLVHNTLTTRPEAELVHAWSDRVYWATCPNANLYIENRLPDYAALVGSGARLTIGTDSLTSNWQLSILEEMKTILRYKSFLDFETVLRWATLNGAEGLGFETDLGSIEPGKTPGLCLLHFDAGLELLHSDVGVERLI